jgi:small-conductance mechanosensitive channel
VEEILWTIGTVLAVTVGALLVLEIIHRIVLRLGRRWLLLNELARHAHRPLQALIALTAINQSLRAVVGDFAGRDAVLHGLVLAMIAAGAWVLAALLLVLEDVALARYRTDVPDNLQARRVHTQVVMVRRVTVAAIVVIAVGVALMTFPGVRAVGASLLASAGIAGVVAALAAQSTLANLFAGLQLAFSDQVRLDDVVVVNGEWGKIEEITLSHVVVRLWDDRRMILPSSHFTSTPYEHWTHSSAQVLGTVELDVDWSVPVPEVRDELRRMLEETDLWDGRTSVLQVTDATGGMIRLRALVSAANAGELWDLRCLVREHLVAWVRDRRPAALPRMRAEVADGAARRAWPWAASQQPSAGEEGEPKEDSRVFGGDPEGDARGQAFTGPDQRASAQR